jgi:CDP-diacylglycerol--glycerol-3-phosphate 3-phosphatidyltransferase
LREFWNLPNVLTLGRIAVIPLFVWLTYDADPLSSFLAAALFAAAAITDIIDGYLARRLNLITVVGKFLDPLADKLIVMAAMVMLVRLGRLAAWVVIVLLARELLVQGLRTIAATEGMVIAAGQEGKWKTSLQLIGIVSLCVHYTHPLDLGFAVYPVDYNLVGQFLLYLSALFSVWSAGVYFRAFLQMLARRGEASG